MSERFRILRKKLGLTQQMFADKIGIPRNNIAGYEAATRNPSEAVINLICREFNVNRKWLETGEGEMFITLSPKEHLASWMGSIVRLEDDNFKLRFINVLSELNEDEWELLEKMANKLVNKKEETD